MRNEIQRAARRRQVKTQREARLKALPNPSRRQARQLAKIERLEAEEAERRRVRAYREANPTWAHPKPGDPWHGLSYEEIGQRLGRVVMYEEEQESPLTSRKRETSMWTRDS